MKQIEKLQNDTWGYVRVRERFCTVRYFVAFGLNSIRIIQWCSETSLLWLQIRISAFGPPEGGTQGSIPIFAGIPPELKTWHLSKKKKKISSETRSAA